MIDSTESKCFLHGWGCYSDYSTHYRILVKPVKLIPSHFCVSAGVGSEEDLCLLNKDREVCTNVSLLTRATSSYSALKLSNKL